MKRIIGVILAIAVAAGCAVVAQARPTPGGSLASHRNHRSADVTFTKWNTSLPADTSTLAGAGMAGVVGGDVGEGTYAGMVVKDDTTSKPGFWLAQALYGFFGSKHYFVANNFITENDTVSPVTARGVSAAKVVATMEVPASHQGMARPERKYSSAEAPARREKARAIPTDRTK